MISSSSPTSSSSSSSSPPPRVHSIRRSDPHAEALDRSREGLAQLRSSLRALKRDVALSFRCCRRDFGVLGRELVAALDHVQQRERLTAAALQHERATRQRAQLKALELRGAFRVVGRVRPPDADAVAAVQVPTPQDVTVQTAGETTKSFSLDRVYSCDATTQQLYARDVQPLAAAAADGHHACVVAYGQTGAGKTHTLQGREQDRGLAWRAADTVFEALAEQQHLCDASVRVQMVEIYNEEVYDLLGSDSAATSPPKPADGSQQWSTNGVVTPFQPTTSHPAFVSRRPLAEIRHGEHGVHLRNAAAVAVHSPDDVVAAMARGDSNRAVLGASADEHCSRSHSVLLMDVSRRSRIDGHVEEGRLVLVDLAGSERLIKNEACGGSRLREAQHINKSISALEDVVNALVAKDKHVPFRNSKLTHLLQDSLAAAHSQLLIVVHVNPAAQHVTETVSSLKFAARISRHQLHASTRRSERLEINRLQSTVSSQSAQLQALQDKLNAELELRKKYEKRLEEYRQEEQRRRTAQRESDDKSRAAPLTPQRGTQSQLQPASTSKLPRGGATPERVALPSSARRLSLFGTRKAVHDELPGRVRLQDSAGQENISENIIRSRGNAGEDSTARAGKGLGFALGTPLRRPRRLSLIGGERRYMFSPTKGSTHTTKRQTGTPAEVRSLLRLGDSTDVLKRLAATTPADWSFGCATADERVSHGVAKFEHHSEKSFQ
ncbi:hypothetical protein ATCC90586_005647 [Pythium insidiosum]|nr:hypothetical protein ATCC90586_005647 [Pythium insidiosum]